MANTTDTELAFTSTTELEAIAYRDARDLMVMLSMQAPHYEPESRASVDIMAVVDRSGSMGDGKLELVKKTLNFMVRELRENDRLGIITFDNNVKVEFPLTKQDQEGRANADNAIQNLRVGGATNLCGGLTQGIIEMRNRSEFNEISSVLLFTDGQANVGYQSLEEIKRVMMDTGALAQSAIDYQGPSFASPFGNVRSPQSMRRNRIVRPNFTRNVQQNLTPVVQQQSNISVPPPIQQQQQQQQQLSSTHVEGNTSAQLNSTNTPLPCTVYTFGYGTDHSADLLRGIADHGDGVYYFIEGNENIAECFADCFGGLLSVTSKDIKLRLSVPNEQNEVMIKHLHNKKYKETKITESKSYEIRIGDIQSEEKKDLLFTLSVPAVAQPIPDNDYVLLNCSLEYLNTITNSTSRRELKVKISRPQDVPEGQQVNYVLDVQRNRIIAVDAMEEANNLGNKGNVAQAKQVVNEAIAKIEGSISGSDPFCVALIEDLRKCEKSLVDQRTWVTFGSKVAQNSASSHSAQRSTNARSASQNVYQTKSRSGMYGKFC